jgi:hypothetical protein
MTISPFRSIAVTAHRPTLPAALTDRAHQPAPVDGMVARPLASHASSAHFSSFAEERLENPSPILASGSALDSPSSPAVNRPLLKGGEYSEVNGIELLNAHFFIGKNRMETAIFRINDDRSVTFIPSDQFKLEFQTFS